MAVNYKQLCSRCRKNYVVVSYRDRYPVCYDCQKSQLDKEIKDPAMKRLFSIPEELYQQSTFLRNIKIAYLSYGRLTEKQVEAFRKAVQKMRKKGPLSR